MTVKFFYKDDVETSELLEKMENDKMFPSHEYAFFYKVENEKEIVSKYPEVKNAVDRSEGLQEFLTNQYFDEDLYAGKNCIYISSEAFGDFSKDYTEDEDFLNEFMSDIEKTLNKMKDNITALLVSGELGNIYNSFSREQLIEITKDLESEGIKILWDMVTWVAAENKRTAINS